MSRQDCSSLAVHHSPQVYSLIIDNYDSYSYNIYQMLAQINGIPPMIVKNDAKQTDWKQVWDLFLLHKKKLEHKLRISNLFYNVVISPGPGHPDKLKNTGFCRDILKMCTMEKIPVFGVCLGHQIIGTMYGAKITKAPSLVHGQHSWIRLDANEKIDTDLTKTQLFSHIPIGSAQGIQVVRYHSLMVADPLPDCLQCLARTCKEIGKEGESDVIMAIQHRELPIYGVQFHPEAICSQFGYQIIQNFRDITTFTPSSRCSFYYTNSYSNAMRSDKYTKTQALDNPCAYAVVIEKITTQACPTFSAFVYEKLYAASDNAFWLDSNNYHPASRHFSQSRFSFMGDTSGPLAKLYEYCAVTQKVCITESSDDTPKERHVQDWLHFLRQELEAFRSHTIRIQPSQTDMNSEWHVPFGFRGGFVGYFAYEALLQEIATADPANKVVTEMKKRLEAGEYIPDASLIFADRTLVFDHENNEIYLVSISESKEAARTLGDWHEPVKKRLEQCASLFKTEGKTIYKQPSASSMKLSNAAFKVSCSHDEYISRIRRAQEYIQQGETYEVCLTNQITVQCQELDHFQLYNILRRHNPAPFAAYLTLHNKTQTSACSGFVKRYSICCSSPERFLKLNGDGWMESKPIKGTRPRGATTKEDEAIAEELATSIKDRAENMMITDLVRNDFGAVAEIGSVHVPSLMKVETFATVHQLVTTVRARLAVRLGGDLTGNTSKPDFFDLFRAAFPGGSMTGAPKLRTMKIISELEAIPRSVYSGALGYVSIPSESSGTGTIADFNIIIRTAVITPDMATMGAGGAIVALSNPEEEYEEMWLKTKALREAILRL